MRRAWTTLLLLAELGIASVGWAADAVGTPASAPQPVELPLADAAWSKAILGVHAIRVATGEEIVGFQADRPLLPASAQKAVTAAAALRGLGPSFHFETRIYATGPVVDGVLEGDLVVVGRGDPTLTADKLWRLVRDLKTDGLVRVAGDVLLDDTYFSGSPLIAGWSRTVDLDEGPSYFAPIGALAAEFGGVTVVVRPAALVGMPAIVAIETPAGDAVRVTAAVDTVGSKERTRLDLRRVVREEGVTFELEGGVRVEGGDRRFRRSVADPTVYFGGILGHLLAEQGLAVDGRIRRGVLPLGSTLLRTITSPPLASVLMDMNKYSSNFMAEAVLRTLGAELRGAGSTEAGLAAMRAHLDALGIAPEQSQLVNGSGLSRDLRFSASAMTRVLADAARDGTIAPEFLASLAIGGRDGTLDDRFEDVPDAVRAKTGTLADTVALVGFVRTAHDELVAFAFFANEIKGPVDVLQGLADEVARRLVHTPPVNGE